MLVGRLHPRAQLVVRVEPDERVRHAVAVPQVVGPPCPRRVCTFSMSSACETLGCTRNRDEVVRDLVEDLDLDERRLRVRGGDRRRVQVRRRGRVRARPRGERLRRARRLARLVSAVVPPGVPRATAVRARVAGVRLGVPAAGAVVAAAAASRSARAAAGAAAASLIVTPGRSRWRC